MVASVSSNNILSVKHLDASTYFVRKTVKPWKQLSYTHEVTELNSDVMVIRITFWKRLHFYKELPSCKKNIIIIYFCLFCASTALTSSLSSYILHLTSSLAFSRYQFYFWVTEPIYFHHKNILNVQLNHSILSQVACTTKFYSNNCFFSKTLSNFFYVQNIILLWTSIMYCI